MIYYDLYLYQKGKNATVLAMSERNLENLTDEQLVRIAQSGDDEALEAILSRYKNLVYSKSKPYFLAGADDDDIIQEGFIGLYKAVKDFDADRFPFFKVFAGVCVTRHIITAVKAASRKKHQPLNSYVSLDKNTYDDDSDTTLLDVMAFNELQDPEAILINRERVDGMEYKINKVLSKLETEVLVCYLEGLSYSEIAAKLGKDTKAVKPRSDIPVTEERRNQAILIHQAHLHNHAGCPQSSTPAESRIEAHRVEKIPRGIRPSRNARRNATRTAPLFCFCRH